MGQGIFGREAAIDERRYQGQFFALLLRSGPKTAVPSSEALCNGRPAFGRLAFLRPLDLAATKVSEIVAERNGKSQMTYSDDEQILLLTMLPSEIGSAVAFSEKSGLIGTAKEMMASAKSAVANAADYPDNALIQSVMPNLDDRSAALDKAKELRERQIERLKAEGITSREEMIEKAVSDAEAVSALLATTADASEAAEYKSWVLSIGQAVANAAKEGGFLGFGGEQVSDGKEAILPRITAAPG